MEWLAPFHPQIVHGPIVLIIVGAVFELIGRALDREWWRKAAFTMLVLGVLGAALAVLSGLPSGEAAEHAGVAEKAVDAHEEAGLLALWIGLVVVGFRALAARPGWGKGLIANVALAAWIVLSVIVGVAAHRGGKLVFEHGAAVHVNGAPVTHAAPGAHGDHDEDERK